MYASTGLVFAQGNLFSAFQHTLAPYPLFSPHLSVRGPDGYLVQFFHPIKKGVFDVLGYDAFLKPSVSTPVSSNRSLY
jgi:hypothetical protein